MCARVCMHVCARACVCAHTPIRAREERVKKKRQVSQVYTHWFVHDIGIGVGLGRGIDIDIGHRYRYTPVWDIDIDTHI